MFMQMQRSMNMNVLHIYARMASVVQDVVGCAPLLCVKRLRLGYIIAIYIVQRLLEGGWEDELGVPLFSPPCRLD